MFRLGRLNISVLKHTYNFCFETHVYGWVARQIQRFDKGNTILYDEIVLEDAFGALVDTYDRVLLRA
ncbi:MAG: hypothetical protein Aurels2KO_33290 [Aureliella sp.]